MFGGLAGAFLLLGACGDSASPPRPGVDSGRAAETEPQEVDFLVNPLLSPTRIEVTVLRESDSSAVAGVDVHVIWRKGDYDLGRLNGTTDGNGFFPCPIHPRSYVHSILVDPTQDTAPAGVMVKEIWEEGRVGSFEVKVAPASKVTGTLVDVDGNPASFQPVQAWFKERWETEGEAPPLPDLIGKTNAEGGFMLSGFPRGAFTVSAEGEGQVAVQRAGGFLDKDEILAGLELQIAPGQLVVGEVHGSETGPLNEALVIAGEPGRRGDYRPTSHERLFHYPAAQVVVRSGGDGAFELPLVPEGRAWNLNVRHPAHQDWYGKIEADQSFVKVEVLAGILLEGKVLDPEGNPVKKVQARLFSGQGRSARTYKPGIFRFRGLSPDPAAVLMLHLPGHRLVTLFPFEIPHPGSMVEFVLQISVPLQGRVVDAAGEPVAGATVVVQALSLPGVDDPSFFPAPHPEQVFSLDRVVTEEDGRFAIPDLRDVDYRVSAEGRDGGRSTPVVVRPGSDPISLQFP